LHVVAITDPRPHYTAHVDQQTYTAVIQQTPTAANDCFFYMKNTSATLDMVLWYCQIRAATAECIETYLNQTGTTSGGTAYVPANSSSGSANTAKGTFEVGNDITGLSGGSLIRRLWIPADNKSHTFTMDGGIIVPPQKTLSMYAVTGGSQVDLNVLFEMHESQH